MWMELNHLTGTRRWLLKTTTDLPGLHLLSPAPEGHIGIIVGGPVPLLLFDLRNQEWPLAVLPLPHPVIVHRLQQIVILVQQQLCLRKRDQLKAKPEHRQQSHTDKYGVNRATCCVFRCVTWCVLAFSSRSTMVSNCRGLISIFLFNLLSSVSSSESMS